MNRFMVIPWKDGLSVVWGIAAIFTTAPARGQAVRYCAQSIRALWRSAGPWERAVIASACRRRAAREPRDFETRIATREANRRLGVTGKALE